MDRNKKRKKNINFRLAKSGTGLKITPEITIAKPDQVVRLGTFIMDAPIAAAFGKVTMYYGGSVSTGAKIIKHARNRITNHSTEKEDAIKETIKKLTEVIIGKPQASFTKEEILMILKESLGQVQANVANID